MSTRAKKQLQKTTISKTDDDVAYHWREFVKFIELEVEAGGPDHNLNLINHMARSDTDDYLELAWRAGCYAGVYVIPAAEAIYQEIPFERARKMSLDEWITWVEDNWPGLALRQERRAVKSRVKLGEYFYSYAQWIHSGRFLFAVEEGGFDAIWDSVMGDLRYVGRYIAVKIVEMLRRMCDLEVEMYDIRPTGGGGWSPRLTLSYLRPEHDDILNRGGDNPRVVAQVNELALEVRDQLNSKLVVIGKPEVSIFTFEVLLCNYRQSLRNRYIGRAHDEELHFYQKIEPYWAEKHGGEVPTQMFMSRAELFDHRALGELRGWFDLRKEAESSHGKFGYFWSDLNYDFLGTEDFSNPKKWPVRTKEI